MKIYLAGPEVFLPDAQEIGAAKKAVCAEYGLEGLFPLDGGLDLSGLTKRQAGLAIYDANIALIEAADGCIANVTPFRGPSLDPGTAYEIGHMRGLRKPVFAYSNDVRLFAARTRAFCGVSGARDEEGLLIEDFGLTDNLMIDGAAVCSGSPILCEDKAGVLDDLAAFRACAARAADILLETRT